MTRDQALQKIKKCLAVARSTSPEEAAIALGQAQKLMAAHQVTERELSLVDVQEVKAKACSTVANRWETSLVNVISNAFGCEVYGLLRGYYNAAGNYMREKSHVFVGLDAAPTIAAYAFEVLARQCVRDRLAHIRKQPKNCKAITKTARGDAFALGWVYAATGKVERLAQSDRDEALLLTYMAEKHPDLTQAKVRDRAKARKTDQGHVLAGGIAGSKAELNHGVGAFAPRGLLGTDGPVGSGS